jgi:hypothetical protein
MIILSLNSLTELQSIAPAFVKDDNKNQDADSGSNSTINSLITLSVGGGGIATFLWGIYEYRKNRILKRQEALFDLIREFDKKDNGEPNKMNLAKLMLDDFTVDEETYSKWEGHQRKGLGHYSIGNAERILRYHGQIGKNDDNFYSVDRGVSIDSPIFDYGEIQVRMSFDELLNFFGKLGYLLDRDIIKNEELKYFEYYIKKTIRNRAVMRYARLYEFENFALLLSKIDNFSNYLRDLPETELPKEHKDTISDWVRNQGRSITGNL